MSNFKYKFESIKKIKKTQEKTVQRDIAVLDLEISELKRKIEVIKEEKAQLRTNSLQIKRVSELQHLNSYEKLLDEKIEEILLEMQSVEKEKEYKMQELIKKSKEVKTFEALEEKHIENYRLEQNKIEQKETDEIAKNKHKSGDKK